MALSERELRCLVFAKAVHDDFQTMVDTLAQPCAPQNLNCGDTCGAAVCLNIGCVQWKRAEAAALIAELEAEDRD